jgi:hypothetical protein
MSLAIFVSPKLVSILDPNSNPIDVWVIEFPFWLAKYLCEQKAQNESDQQVDESFQSVSPVYHYSGIFLYHFLIRNYIGDRTFHLMVFLAIIL